MQRNVTSYVISSSKSPLHKFYCLCGVPYIQNIWASKLTGGSKHISMVSARGNTNLIFHRKILKAVRQKLRDTAYCSIVQPSLEYSCSVWSLFKKIDGTKLEKVQQRATHLRDVTESGVA